MVHASGTSKGERGQRAGCGSSVSSSLAGLPTQTPLPPFSSRYRMVFFLEDAMACTKRLLEWIAGWLPRHFIGAILVSLPALAVYSHITPEFEMNIHVSKDLAIYFCALWTPVSLLKNNKSDDLRHQFNIGP